MKGKENLLGMEQEDFEKLMQERGEPRYRGGQLMQWVYRGVPLSEMTNLPERLREELDSSYSVFIPVIEQVQVSRDGTRKYLLALEDGQTIETVHIPEEDRNTVCVSTQVGCAMGCTFCATGLGGFSRNLTAAEITGQVLTVRKNLGVRISNIVLMGMGEPLANYDNSLRAVRVFNAENAFDIGIRHITLSTCGLVPNIQRLMGEKLQLVLAVSLHAPNNDLRNEIMPINRRYPLEVLIPACREYARITGRRVSFEYALVKGFNDRPEHARELASLLSGILCHVNLIPLNTVQGTNLTKPNEETVRRFQQILTANGIETTVRTQRGADIDAACGQLRSKRNGQ